MVYTNHVLVAISLCMLFASCSVSQTNPKPTAWPSRKPVAPSGISVEGGRFQSKPGGFRIKIPELPFQTNEMASEKARAKGVDTGKQYAWKFDETLYTVMYSPPVDFDGNPLPQVFEDMVNGSRKG